MILQSLVGYYESLAKKGEISKLGWGLSKVSYALVLNEQGDLIQVLPLKQEVKRGKKTVELPQVMEVPEPVKRSVGVSANFLCDNSAYLLGIDNKGKPERTRECFDASRKLHLSILEGIETPMSNAIKNYFTKWQPEKAKDSLSLADLYDEVSSGSNLIFQLGMEYAQEDNLIQAAWNNRSQESKDEPVMQCLITGDKATIARIHPSIKGVRGAQSSGAALISFNADSFCSYDKEQNFNSPISKYAAFAYTTALNHLLSDEAHKQQLGDTTIIYWAEDAEPAYQDLFGIAFAGGNSEFITDNDLHEILKDIASGKAINWNAINIKPDNKFYILGLAPNAARLSVRFFLRDNFGSFIGNLKEHYDRLEIDKPSYDKRETLGLYSLLNETVNQNSKDKKPQPLLAGTVIRAVLSNERYPEALFTGVMLRVRAESEITRGRASIIKAYLLKNYNDKAFKEALTVELNDQCTYLPYVLGCLFSVYEAIQLAANPNINTTIKDKYFNSASATPASIIPLLTKLSQNHLKKLDVGLRVFYEKQIIELTSKIDKDYPVRMTLQDQGIFQLGYYHQTQKRYQKNNKEDKPNV